MTNFVVKWRSDHGRDGAITRGVVVQLGHKVFSGYDITLVELPEYLIGSHQYQLSIDYTIDILGKVHLLNSRAIKVSQM